MIIRKLITLIILISTSALYCAEQSPKPRRKSLIAAITSLRQIHRQITLPEHQALQAPLPCQFPMSDRLELEEKYFQQFAQQFNLAQIRNLHNRLMYRAVEPHTHEELLKLIKQKEDEIRLDGKVPFRYYRSEWEQEIIYEI